MLQYTRQALKQSSKQFRISSAESLSQSLLRCYRAARQLFSFRSIKEMSQLYQIDLEERYIRHCRLALKCVLETHIRHIRETWISVECCARAYNTKIVFMLLTFKDGWKDRFLLANELDIREISSLCCARGFRFLNETNSAIFDNSRETTRRVEWSDKTMTTNGDCLPQKENHKINWFVVCDVRDARGERRQKPIN